MVHVKLHLQRPQDHRQQMAYDRFAMHKLPE